MIFYEFFCKGPSALHKYALTAVRWLRIQFSTKILSPRRGCGRVGVASGPGNFSLEVGNYDKESGTEEDGFDKWFELFEEGQG